MPQHEGKFKGYQGRLDRRANAKDGQGGDDPLCLLIQDGHPRFGQAGIQG